MQGRSKCMCRCKCRVGVDVSVGQAGLNISACLNTVNVKYLSEWEVAQ